MDRYSAATGLDRAHTIASTGARTRRPRWSASAAASAKATPRAKGRRLVKSSVAEPAAKSSVPTRASRGPQCSRASSVNAALAATVASAPIS